MGARWLGEATRTSVGRGSTGTGAHNKRDCHWLAAHRGTRGLPQQLRSRQADKGSKFGLRDAQLVAVLSARYGFTS